ncbi:ferredoxin, 2fe-2S-like protein [Angomonas deanei]|uniref:2Fe-2S iron-sulfur cluster binding domain containing protein, putative n=1 Tax=Angomonas deanei TaxID=59799 RepID=A0A7G2C1C9_9TRYP|nr:ferredoxin, 2fe-2S-like protein [Angomonas deanei]CAD2213530.1 2Fe-2S iron-sulfur cluster binding domain containing protein, putative [Angomonas deanei]|eukprot:EPY28889.1 ferredoxin, 2fe-2S-like protein [Angomonas deanei]
MLSCRFFYFSYLLLFYKATIEIMLSCRVAVGVSLCRVGLRRCSTQALKIKVHCKGTNGKVHTASYSVGGNLMESIRDDGSSPIDMQGICKGTAECSTCHVYIAEQWYHKVIEGHPVSEHEDDLLDKVPHFEENRSRLACQISLTSDLDGLELSLPKETRDLRWQQVLERAQSSRAAK